MQLPPYLACEMHCLPIGEWPGLAYCGHGVAGVQRPSQIVCGGGDNMRDPRASLIVAIDVAAGARAAGVETPSRPVRGCAIRLVGRRPPVRERKCRCE